MIRMMASVVMLCIASPIAWAQQADSPPADTGTTPAEPVAHQQIREKLAGYLECFNSHDADALAGHWTADCVSIAEETGEQTSGREALQQELTAFFAVNGDARLTGELKAIHLIRPDVASIEGQTTLFAGDSEPVETAFTAVMVKEGDQWLISTSHERDVPRPASHQDALRELEWLIGTWQDQTEGANVTSTVQWSANGAFLLRSFSAQFEDGDLSGTQIIGWDPLNNQLRTWTFNSDGSFGQGTLTRHDDDMMEKMWQVTSDGRLASGTKVLTRVDDNTVTVEAIGVTIDGELQPSSDPVTVARIAAAGDEEPQSPQDAPADSQEGAQ